MHSLNWYAIQSKPCREDLAALNIERLGLEVLLPRVRQERWTNCERKVIVRPLFNTYLFARFAPPHHLHQIGFARGVRRILSADGQPVPVDVEIIEAIRSRIFQNALVRTNDETWQPGTRLKVQAGPLQGLEGVFERELSDQRRVLLLLETIHYQARVLIEKERLELAG